MDNDILKRKAIKWAEKEDGEVGFRKGKINWLGPVEFEQLTTAAAVVGQTEVQGDTLL